ncbi:MAG TPA: recombinase family protein [Actinomycetota bacterium]|nr:recombinase family protein [Actinomycetota bacterium]
MLNASCRRRIARMRRSGATLASIAESLNTEAVPTAHGGARWYPSTVRKVLQAA